MAVGKVTNHAVDEIKAGPRDIFLWDADLAGFGVRVTSGGTKSYICQFRMAGRASITQRYTIGRHRSPWTARTARDKAKHLLRQVEKGKNPVEKRRERRRKEVELRFSAYVEFFSEHYLRRRWKDCERTRNMLIRHAVPTLGQKKLSDITRADLTVTYERLDNTPSVARALHATLRKMFRWAQSRDDLKHSPVVGVDAPPLPRARDRYLSNTELGAAWLASHSLPRAYATLFRLLILTGQRRGEVVGLRWSELDREAAEWKLPSARSKNRRSHVIPLSCQAIAELDLIAGGVFWPCDGIVLESSHGTVLSGFSKIKKEWDRQIASLLKAGNGPSHAVPWRLHDLRRTVATGMQALQIRTEVIEAVLNHFSGMKAGIVSVYQCYDYRAEKKMALDKWDTTSSV